MKDDLRRAHLGRLHVQVVRPQRGFDFEDDGEDEDELASGADSSQLKGRLAPPDAKQPSGLAKVMQMLQIIGSLGGEPSIGDLQEMHKVLTQPNMLGLHNQVFRRPPCACNLPLLSTQAAVADAELELVEEIGHRLHTILTSHELSPAQREMAGRLATAVAYSCSSGTLALWLLCSNSQGLQLRW